MLEIEMCFIWTLIASKAAKSSETDNRIVLSRSQLQYLPPLKEHKEGERNVFELSLNIQPAATTDAIFTDLLAFVNDVLAQQSTLVVDMK